jgi:hypothetical protein
MRHTGVVVQFVLCRFRLIGLESRVILTANINGFYHYGRNLSEMGAIISLALRGEGRLDDDGYTAFCFMLAEMPHSREIHGWWPDNYLQGVINLASGYGGLVWFATVDRLADGISEYIWVTDTPFPPESDPEVVCEDAIGECFDPRSLLSVDMIRIALEEYCQVGTGVRPEQVGWVHGKMTGARVD